MISTYQELRGPLQRVILVFVLQSFDQNLHQMQYHSHSIDIVRSPLCFTDIVQLSRTAEVASSLHLHQRPLLVPYPQGSRVVALHHQSHSLQLDQPVSCEETSSHRWTYLIEQVDIIDMSMM